MRVNFEIEIFSKSLAFILIKGTRRGFVAHVPANPAHSKWIGQLEGKRNEIKIAGDELHNLEFRGRIYKYSDPRHAKPANLRVYN